MHDISQAPATFISIFQSITTYGSAKASPTLEEHIHWIPCGYDGSVLCWLGLKMQTAHSPCLFPLFVGSSPHTNLATLGRANVMRQAVNHSSTCWALLGIKTEKLPGNNINEQMHICTTFQIVKILNCLKYSVCTLKYVHKVPDKQVERWCQTVKALLKIFLDRPVITSSSFWFAHSHTTHTHTQKCLSSAAVGWQQGSSHTCSSQTFIKTPVLSRCNTQSLPRDITQQEGVCVCLCACC